MNSAVADPVLHTVKQLVRLLPALPLDKPPDHELVYVWHLTLGLFQNSERFEVDRAKVIRLTFDLSAKRWSITATGVDLLI